MNELVNSDQLQKSRNELGAIGVSSAQKEAESMKVAMYVAQSFPRDIAAVEDKIYQHCTRTRFAENAEYCYPRSGKDIKGPTIKLVEAIAQCYGNIQSDVKELKRYSNYSECETSAWDMENNVKVSRNFSVPHYRDTKNGRKQLTDDRDIREMVFNYGSRNLRACLERVIPRDLIETAIEWCNQTLNSDTRPLGDRTKDCKNKFLGLDATLNTEFLEKLVGEKTEKWTNSTIKKLGGYYTALKEGDITMSDLQANFTETISREQIKELASIIGTDEKKIAVLKGAGYAMPEIKKIPKTEYDHIKQLLTAGQTKNKSAGAETK